MDKLTKLLRHPIAFLKDISRSGAQAQRDTLTGPVTGSLLRPPRHLKASPKNVSWIFGWDSDEAHRWLRALQDAAWDVKSMDLGQHAWPPGTYLDLEASFDSLFPQIYKWLLRSLGAITKFPGQRLFVTSAAGQMQRLLAHVASGLGWEIVALPPIIGLDVLQVRQGNYYDSHVTVAATYWAFSAAQQHSLLAQGIPDYRIVPIPRSLRCTIGESPQAVNSRTACGMMGFELGLALIVIGVRIPAHQSWQSTIVLERCHRLLSVLGNCLAAHTNLAIQVVFQGLPDECDHAPETFYAVLSHNHRMKIEDLRRPILQISEVLSIASGCININQCFNLSICPQGTKTIDWDLAQDECDLEAILIPILLAFAGAKPSASALPTDLINSVVEPASEGSRYPWCPADEIRSVLHAGTIGVHSEFLINAETNLFLPRLLKARKLMVPETPGEAFRCRHLVQWGISKGRRKDLLRGLATVTGQAVWIAEDSFYRSIGLGIQREPGLGICLDDQTAHYDAKRPSRLETMLTSPWKISPQDQQRTRRIIDRITHSHISKYNQSPQQDIASRLSTTDAILVVDQRAGDQSIVSAGGSPKTFTAMLCEAIAIANGKRQIIVKTHPDANSGVKAAHYTPEMLAHFSHHDNITVLTDDVDPYCVFAACSDVIVCSSGLGFEALLAGKRVICHGLPFYAGWGLTRDHIRCVRRKIQRTIEEIFFLTILRYSLHIDPVRGHVVDFEHSLEYLLLARELFLDSKDRTQPGEG